MFRLFGNTENGVYFAPNKGGESAPVVPTVPTVPQQQTTTAEEEESDDDEDTEPGENATADEWKAWNAKQVEKAKAEASSLTPEQIEAAKTQAIEDFKKSEKLRLAAEKRKDAAKNGDKDAVISSLQEEVNTLKAENDTLKAENQKVSLETIKQQVAAKFKLPPKMASRLQGTTMAELEADAKDLSREIPTATTRPDLEGGQRSTSTKEKQVEGSQKVARTLVGNSF